MLRKVLACALCAALWLIVAAVAPAAITQEGGVSITPQTVQVGTTQQQTTGPFGDGKLWVTTPSTLTSQFLSIGTTSGNLAASGAVYVQGGSITHSDSIAVGDSGHGRLEVTGGGQAFGGAVRIGGNGAQQLSQGVAIVDGFGSKLIYSQNLTIGLSGDGQLHVTGGGTVVSGAATFSPISTIGRTTGSTGLVVVDGAGSLWQHGGEIQVGQGGPGTLRITDGGVVISTGGRVGGESQGAAGQVVIDGPGSRWTVGNLSLGTYSQWGTGEVIVTNGGTLDHGTTPFRAALGQTGFGRVVVSGPTSRWIHPGTPVLGSGSGGIGEIVLEDGTQFTSAGMAILGGRVLVDGPMTRWTSTGSLNLGNAERTATIELSDGATLTHVQPGGTMSIGKYGQLLLARGRVVASNSQGPLTNNGLIQGGGLLQIGPMTNNGRIVVGAGEKLQIPGQIMNAITGRIEVDGELEVGPFTSAAGSRLIANGTTLRAPAGTGPPGWSGKGNITFASGRNRVFGSYSNATTVIASGAAVEFYDDVTNLGPNVISAAATSKLTAFGAFNGNGVAGAGESYLEGLVQPANIGLGTMSFGGDLYLGGASRLVIQVGGGEGTHDAIESQGLVSLSGALQLNAVGELPTPTALLPIVSAGELSGVFSSTPAIGANIGAGVRFHGVTYDYANDEALVSLTQGLPADFNLDGVQDGADLLTWQRALGTACEPGMGADATCDGVVDGADLAVWQAAIGAQSGAFNGAQTAVPEPASWALALLVTGSVGRLRRLPRRRPASV